MSIKTAYISKLGADHAISTNFKLGEFQCKDGSDKVLYSAELLKKLEELRVYGGFTVTVNSGYRTASYNKKIGGAEASQHLKGTAVDVVVNKDGRAIDAKKICCLGQTLGFKGIAYISATAVHLDMREAGSYRGDERSGYDGNVGNDFYSYFRINKADIAALQDQTLRTEGDDEMTQEQFNQMMNNYIATLKTTAPSDWSKEARAWAEENGIIAGDDTGQKQYKSFCTREQLVVVLYRLFRKIKGA